MFKEKLALSLENVPERYAAVEKLIAEAARDNNQFLQEKSGRSDVDYLNSDGRINMRAFWTKKGGPYAKTGAGGVTEDERFNLERELTFAGVLDDDGRRVAQVEKYYRDSGCASDEQIAATFKKSKSNTFGQKSEKAILALLHKALGKQFVVAHAAAYDDYAHGVDYVLLDRESGEVICAFDGVSDDKGGDRYENKIKKIRQKALAGGASIKYGLTLDKDEKGNSRLAQKQIEGVPIFCAALNMAEVERLLVELGSQKELSAHEKQIFEKMVADLAAQTEALLARGGLAIKMGDNLHNFQNVLQKISNDF